MHTLYLPTRMPPKAPLLRACHETIASCEKKPPYCSNGTLFEKHHLRVDAADGDAKFDPKRSVFVGNVPFGWLVRA